MIQPFHLCPATGIFPPHSAEGMRRALAVVGTALAITFLLLLVLAFAAPKELYAQEAAHRGDEELPAGLFFRAERADAAYQAPLLDSEVSITVNGMVARVTLRQRFENPAAVWLEGVYVFPLPERSAVERLVMVIGDRRVEGRIMEKAEAEKVYREAAENGQHASLLASERPNVFATSVANIGPGEQITVEIQYQDAVTYDNGRFEYRFPMVVAPRFTAPAPQVAGREGPRRAASAVRPAAGDGDLFGPVRHPRESTANRLRLSFSLTAGLPLRHLKSLYHPVTIESRDDGRHLVELADGAVQADRDFVLEWTPRIGDEPEAAVFAEEIDGDSHLLVMVLPPRRPLADEGRMPSLAPRDVTFIVDTSGSMYGPSMDQAKEAVIKALQRLGAADRFNVIRFADETHALFRRPEPATTENVSRAWHYVKAFEAEGGTMMRPALELALATAVPEAAEAGRLAQIIFVTDGAVSNESELLQLIAAGLGRARLFTIGIGSAPNAYFMRKSAEIGRGTYSYIGDVSEVAARMEPLLRKLESPVLTDISVAWPGLAGGEAEQYPQPLPDLYAGEPILFTARLEGVPASALGDHLLVDGWHGEHAWQRRLSLTDPDNAPGVAAIWARAKLEQIEDGLYLGQNPQAVRRQALAVALRHRLVTRYTSLVAVDEEVVRPPEEALESAEVARDLPAGWSYEHVFGEADTAMELRELPAPLLQQTGTATPIALPRGATTARQQFVMAAGFLSLSLLLLVLVRLRRSTFRGRIAGRHP